MLDKWWHRRGKELSAFADAELTGAAADRVAERLVFEAEARQDLDRLRRLDTLVAAALAPTSSAPNAGAVADAVLAQLPKAPTPAPIRSRNWTPTVVASVGLLVTAGVAFAGLKRRGWV
jgi:anti-sigma factor RsiW